MGMVSLYFPILENCFFFIPPGKSFVKCSMSLAVQMHYINFPNLLFFQLSPMQIFLNLQHLSKTYNCHLITLANMKISPNSFFLFL